MGQTDETAHPRTAIRNSPWCCCDELLLPFAICGARERAGQSVSEIISGADESKAWRLHFILFSIIGDSTAKESRHDKTEVVLLTPDMTGFAI